MCAGVQVHQHQLLSSDRNPQPDSRQNEYMSACKIRNTVLGISHISHNVING